jgi:hypothetical protein
MRYSQSDGQLFVCAGLLCDGEHKTSEVFPRFQRVGLAPVRPFFEFSETGVDHVCDRGFVSAFEGVGCWPPLDFERTTRELT